MSFDCSRYSAVLELDRRIGRWPVAASSASRLLFGAGPGTISYVEPSLVERRSTFQHGWPCTFTHSLEQR